MRQLVPFLGVGLLVGAVVWWIARGRERGGWVVALMLGVLGSFIAVLLGPLLEIYAETGPGSLIASALGALTFVVANSTRTRPNLS